MPKIDSKRKLGDLKGLGLTAQQYRTDSDWKEIIEYINAHQDLTYLDLSNNRLWEISDEEKLELTDAISKHPSLEEINLDGNSGTERKAVGTEVIHEDVGRWGESNQKEQTVYADQEYGLKKDLQDKIEALPVVVDCLRKIPQHYNQLKDKNITPDALVSNINSIKSTMSDLRSHVNDFVSLAKGKMSGGMSDRLKEVEALPDSLSYQTLLNLNVINSSLNRRDVQEDAAKSFRDIFQKLKSANENDIADNVVKSVFEMIKKINPEIFNTKHIDFMEQIHPFLTSEQQQELSQLLSNKVEEVSTEFFIKKTDLKKKYQEAVYVNLFNNTVLPLQQKIIDSKIFNVSDKAKNSLTKATSHLIQSLADNVITGETEATNLNLLVLFDGKIPADFKNEAYKETIDKKLDNQLIDVCVKGVKQYLTDKLFFSSANATNFLKQMENAKSYRDKLLVIQKVLESKEKSTTQQIIVDAISIKTESSKASPDVQLRKAKTLIRVLIEGVGPHATKLKSESKFESKSEIQYESKSELSTSSIRPQSQILNSSLVQEPPRPTSSREQYAHLLDEKPSLQKTKEIHNKSQKKSIPIQAFTPLLKRVINNIKIMDLSPIRSGSVSNILQIVASPDKKTISDQEKLRDNKREDWLKRIERAEEAANLGELISIAKEIRDLCTWIGSDTFLKLLHPDNPESPKSLTQIAMTVIIPYIENEAVRIEAEDKYQINAENEEKTKIRLTTTIESEINEKLQSYFNLREKIPQQYNKLIKDVVDRNKLFQSYEKNSEVSKKSENKDLWLWEAPILSADKKQILWDPAEALSPEIQKHKNSIEAGLEVIAKNVSIIEGHLNNLQRGNVIKSVDEDKAKRAYDNISATLEKIESSFEFLNEEARKVKIDRDIDQLEQEFAKENESKITTAKELGMQLYKQIAEFKNKNPEWTKFKEVIGQWYALAATAMALKAFETNPAIDLDSIVADLHQSANNLQGLQESISEFKGMSDQINDLTTDLNTITNALTSLPETEETKLLKARHADIEDKISTQIQGTKATETNKQTLLNLRKEVNQLTTIITVAPQFKSTKKKMFNEIIKNIKDQIGSVANKENREKLISFLKGKEQEITTILSSEKITIEQLQKLNSLETLMIKMRGETLPNIIAKGMSEMKVPEHDPLPKPQMVLTPSAQMAYRQNNLLNSNANKKTTEPTPVANNTPTPVAENKK